MKPLIYPFENPSMTVGLAAINATEPAFIVEPRHLEAWFKEGAIGRYMLVDDIRELWNREGFGTLFDLFYGEAKHCTLIASCRTDMEWSKTERGEKPTYSVFGIDTAASLYQMLPDIEQGGRSSDPPRQNMDTPCPDYLELDFPMPEPVLPRYEAQKIYNMIHSVNALEVQEKAPKVRTTKLPLKALVEALTVVGLTDEDYKGEIPTLQQKLTRLGLGGTLTSIDKNTLDDWLKKGGVR